MSILVNGFEVRADELNYNFIVNFEDLNESGQRRLFEKDKNLFLYDALTSQYPDIRELPFESKTGFSSETLNEVLSKFIPQIPTLDFQNIDIILKLLDFPDFKLNEKLRDRMTMSTDYRFLFWVAKSKDTSFNILKKMFFYECKNFICYGYSELLDIIILNPNFNLSYSLDREVELRFKAEHYRDIMSHIKDLKNPRKL